MGFITEWNMPSGNFTLPLRSGKSYNMVVDWGDGSATQTITAYNDVNATHNYATAGTYLIELTGSCGAWYINNNSSIKLKLTKVVSWGDGVDFIFTDGFALYAGFYGCVNLIELPDGPIMGATALTTIANILKYTGLNYLPSSLLSLCPNINTLSGAFSNMSNLISVPTGFLDSVSSSTASLDSVFLMDINLESIPNGLLRRFTSAYVNYMAIFSGCNKLQINPNIWYNDGEQSTRFLNKSANFTACFSRTSFTGAQGIAPDLWNCNFGSGTATKTNCFSGIGNSNESITNYNDIPTEWGAVHPKLLSLTSEKINFNTQKAIILCSLVVPENEEVICYGSISDVNLVSPENILALSTEDNITFEASLTGLEDVTNYYFYVEYKVNDTAVENLTNQGVFYTAIQVPTTIINVPTGNFITMSSPEVSMVHGTIALNGYVYGTTRAYKSPAYTGVNLFKVKQDDYSFIYYQTIFFNKNAQTTILLDIEQIVHCKGFLWALSNGKLIRINPSDMDYMVFWEIDTTDKGQPIGTDGEFLFITTNERVYKIDTNLLLDSFATYGYIGDSAVILPPASILGDCQIIQYDPSPAYLHSIISDAGFIYLAITSSFKPNGYVEETGNYQYHLQKIDKATMLTVGDVPICKCTDDMTQNDRYIFLAPEMINTTIPMYGADFGLLAIRKTDLTVRYLKALHSEFLSANEADRQSFGVQYFGDYMAVQLVSSKKTAIIDTSNVDSWGASFPIGGATIALLSFQFNGVDAAYASNEMSIDSNGIFHANTWGLNTTIYKFIIDGLSVSYPPIVQSVLIQSLINGTTIGGSILSPGSSDVTMVGLRYGTVSTNLDQIISFENPSINFQSVLNLTPGIYYFQAYAANSVGTSYGAIVPFVVGNTVILSHNSAGAAASLRNNNCGHAVRFCKRAWGVADGTIGSATDASGNTYKTVVINEIEWAAADLKTALYNNEDVIPEIQDNTAWSTTTDGARAGYNNVLPE